jgi:Flp pilus assembly protein TadB
MARDWMAGDCIDSRDQANQKANAQTTEGRSHAVILPHFEILRRENSGPD